MNYFIKLEIYESKLRKFLNFGSYPPPPPKTEEVLRGSGEGGIKSYIHGIYSGYTPFAAVGLYWQIML